MRLTEVKNMIPDWRVIVVLIGLLVVQIPPELQGQIGIPTFEEGRKTYKQLMKEAYMADNIALIILYSDLIATNVLPKIQNPDTIKANTGVITDIVNPYQQTYYPIIDRVRPFKNPLWITVDPTNIIINSSSTIVTDDQLSTFIRKSKKLSDDYHNYLNAHEADKNDRDALRGLISTMIQFYEKEKASKYINRYLRGIKKITVEEAQFISNLALASPSTDELVDFIEEHNQVFSKELTRSQRNLIKAKAIQYDLDEKNLLEPFYVWKEYEKELGMDADSLYRIFAIGYFAEQPGTTSELVNECIDFLANYPHADWEVQDPMFKVALLNSSKKEDIEFLLDLISGQIFKEESYIKLDYRAVALYKLGQEERALKMISDITAKAAEKGIRHKPLLHQLKK